MCGRKVDSEYSFCKLHSATLIDHSFIFLTCTLSECDNCSHVLISLTDRRFWETCYLQLNFITPWTPASSLRRGSMFLQTSLHVTALYRITSQETIMFICQWPFRFLYDSRSYDITLRPYLSNFLSQIFSFLYSRDLSHALCWQHVRLIPFCYSRTW